MRFTRSGGCADDVLKCQQSLTWGWSIDIFRDKENTESVAALAVDSAVTDDGFWYSMEALSHLQFVVQEMLDWAGVCPCNSGWLTGVVPKDAARHWQSCLLRTMSLPEVVARDLARQVKDVMRLQAVGLALRAPPSLDSQRRDCIIGEYLKAQGN